MSNKIFGYDWEDIQSMQQGTYTRPTIDAVKRTIAATDNDMMLLDKHGIDGLRELKFYGVLDRLGVQS